MAEIMNGQDTASEPTPAASSTRSRTRKATESRPVELRKSKGTPVGTVIRGYPTEVTYSADRSYPGGEHYAACIVFRSAYAGKAIRNEDRSAPGATASVDGERMAEFLTEVVGMSRKATESPDAVRKALASYSERLAEVTLKAGREVRFEFAPVTRTRKGGRGKAEKPVLPANKAEALAR